MFTLAYGLLWVATAAYAALSRRRTRAARWVATGSDEFVMLVHPSHPLASRGQVSMAEFAHETVVAHNETSPARERVLRLFEQRHEPINIQVALPSIDAIKRAVEMNMGVALLPRRCATAELARGTLAAVHVSQVRMPRQLRVIFRASGQRSAAAEAFLAAAREYHDELVASHAVGAPKAARIRR
jgi:DNA-binding transcriptional LysR family regulator